MKSSTVCTLPPRYETTHSSISIIAQALDFPTVYINFQPVTESLTTAQIEAVEGNLHPERLSLHNSNISTSNTLQTKNNHHCNNN